MTFVGSSRSRSATPKPISSTAAHPLVPWYISSQPCGVRIGGQPAPMRLPIPVRTPRRSINKPGIGPVCEVLHRRCVPDILLAANGPGDGIMCRTCIDFPRRAPRPCWAVSALSQSVGCWKSVVVAYAMVGRDLSTLYTQSPTRLHLPLSTRASSHPHSSYGNRQLRAQGWACRHTANYRRRCGFWQRGMCDIPSLFSILRRRTTSPSSSATPGFSTALASHGICSGVSKGPAPWRTRYFPVHTASLSLKLAGQPSVQWASVVSCSLPCIKSDGLVGIKLGAVLDSIARQVHEHFRSAQLTRLIHRGDTRTCLAGNQLRVSTSK